MEVGGGQRTNCSILWRKSRPGFSEESKTALGGKRKSSGEERGGEESQSFVVHSAGILAAGVSEFVERDQDCRRMNTLMPTFILDGPPPILCTYLLLNS